MGRNIYGKLINNVFGQLDDTEPNDTYVLRRLINSNPNYKNGFIPLELLNKDRRGRQRLDIRNDNDFYRLVTGNPDGVRISSVFQFQAPIDMIYYPDDVLSILPDDVMLDVIERYNDFIKKGKTFSKRQLSPIPEEEEQEEEETPNLSVNLMPPLEKQLMDLKSELNKCRNEVKRCHEGKMAEKKRKRKEQREAEFAAEEDSDSEYDKIDDTSETSPSDIGSGRRRKTQRRKRKKSRQSKKKKKGKKKKPKKVKKKPKTKRKR